VALGNAGAPSDVPVLVETPSDDSALVREHAAWALGRLADRFPGFAETVRSAMLSRLEVEGDERVRAELGMVLAGVGAS
jgi:epoxyqueuosine reductase